MRSQLTKMVASPTKHVHFRCKTWLSPMLAGMGQNNRKSWAIRHWWCQVFTPKRNHKTKWEWTVLRTPDLDGEFAYCFSFGWKQTAAEHCRRWHTTTLRTGLLPLDTLRDAKEIGYCFGEPLPTGPNCFELWCASLYSIYIYIDRFGRGYSPRCKKTSNWRAVLKAVRSSTWNMVVKVPLSYLLFCWQHSPIGNGNMYIFYHFFVLCIWKKWFNILLLVVKISRWWFSICCFPQRIPFLYSP